MILKTDYSGKTRQAVGLWEETKKQLGEIKEILLWKNKEDAILKGYYETENVQGTNLERITNVPTMVIIDNFGDELRVNGCNCGYGGGGPNGSIRILKDIGLVNIDDVVKGNDIVQIKLGGSDPIIQTEQSEFDTFMRGAWESNHGYSRISSADIYKQGSFLIFIEDKEGYEDEVGFLHYYLFRLIDKVNCVTIFANQADARSKGKVIPPRYEGDDERIFQVVVRGENGVEIWLSKSILENEKFENQEIIQKILEIIQFPKLDRSQSPMDKIKKTIGRLEEKSITLLVDSGELVINPAI